MFFFFFDMDIEQLNENSLFKEAFNNVIFKKLKIEGYCDINSLIGKSKLTKLEMERRLKASKSPLAILFSQKYPKDKKELEERLLPVLEEMGSDKKIGNYNVNEEDYFSIVFYYFQTHKSLDEKTNQIKKIYTEWNKEEKGCDLRLSNGIIYDALRVDIHFISSISEYIEFLGEIKDKKYKTFFRGHSKVSYRLIPSLFRREEWLENERKMYLELITKCPFEFMGLHSHIEKLAEMQHYGLPTRLLDVTQNPLVALYFACESETDYRGEVILLCDRRENIKYFESDTVAMIASLPLFKLEEQREIYKASLWTKPIYSSPYERVISKLVSEIRLERLSFKQSMDLDDLRSVVICIPARKNRRIENQEGAFIVCGLIEETYGRKITSTLSNLRVKNKEGKKIICIIENKRNIKKQLDEIGINKSKMYPEIDDVADYIKTHMEDI